MLISRSTGERLPITYRAPEGVVFHFINCYEESNHLVCDVSFFPKSTKIIQHIYFDIMLEDAKAGRDIKSAYTRFVLPLSLDGVRCTFCVQFCTVLYHLLLEKKGIKS